jgi:DNA polymerase-3 subunit alpha
MQISRDVCGFTGGESDTLRKGVGKKKLDILQKMETKFVEGAVANGVPREIIEKFWRDLLGFADYCFNKSHSACYGLTSYWTAYLKAHYPSAFMAALMTSDYDDTDRLSIEISECQKMGIAVLPPDISESYLEFAVVPDKKDPDNRKAAIRFGMNAIKNVGTGAVEEIIRARKIDGEFKDLEDFLSKVNPRIVNRKTIESLVRAGAFDRYCDRSELLHNLDGIIAYAQRMQKEASSGQVDLFGAAPTDDSDAMKPKLVLEKADVVYTQREQLIWERDLMGLYLSQNPLKMYEAFLAEQTVPMKDLKPEHEGRSVTVGGSISDVREITTKNSAKMAFVKLEDLSGVERELILFPGAYQQTTGLWERDKVVLVRGKINAKDRDGNISEDIKIMVDDAREITSAQAQNYKPTGKRQPAPGVKKSPAAAVTTTKVNKEPIEKPAPKRVYLRLADTKNQDILIALKRIVDAAPGKMEVVLVVGPAEEKQIIKLPVGVADEAAVLLQLEEIVGKGNVKIQ